MKKLLLSLTAIITLGCTARSDRPANVSLKDAVQDKFLIGAAMNMKQINGIDTKSVDIVKHHFNSIVAENCMKSAPIQPKKGEFYFEDADKFVSFGEDNDMFIVGHTLIWHQQAPKWFFVDDEGKDVSRDELIARMKNHISTIVGRYKGRVHGWDVVNEALEDNGEWRRTKFYEIIGEDYIRLAFEFAREADPDAELYYNDYSMAKQGRREAVVNMINDLRKQGVEIDGIGMQGHLTMTYPPIDEFEKSLIAFSQAGVKVMITELDLGVLPGGQGADLALNYTYDKVMNPYVDSLPQSVAAAWQARYADFFRLFMKHSDKISRVTLWGVSDSMSWKNNWPMRGRTDYPLLFDRNYEAKPIVKEIIEMAQAVPVKRQR